MKQWTKPIYDDVGMTQWYWRVIGIENFQLGERIEIGSFTIIDAKEGVIIEDDVKIAHFIQKGLQEESWLNEKYGGLKST